MEGGYGTVNRSGNSVSFSFGCRIKRTSDSWVSNALAWRYPNDWTGAQRYGRVGSGSKNTWYYSSSSTRASYTSEATPYSYSGSVSGTGGGNISLTVGWNDSWTTPTANTNAYSWCTGWQSYSFSVPYPAAASWTVSYNANGGSSTPSSQTKWYGVNISLRGAISRANSYPAGYTVTFDGNGGTPSKTSQQATNTTTYSFAHWKASNGTTYAAGATYSANEGTTMTAQWNSSTTNGSITTATASKSNGTATRTVTFNATSNGGTCSTASRNSTATITYSCTGWWTATSGGTRRATSGGSYTPSSSEKVYAQWSSTTGSYSAVSLPAASKANDTATRTVTFNANGGTCSTSSLKSTATITYTHTGWFTSASGGTKRGASGGSYTPSASETIYAQFSSSTGSYSAITLPTPTRVDYIFMGWATSASATSGVTGSYTPSSDITLYATWKEDQAKVKIKKDGKWNTGKAFIKVNGKWEKAKKVYIKKDGKWIVGVNS